jgi:hypothetical protein
MAMDKLNTKVSMSLHDYENLKEFQQNCREMHKQIKSMISINKTNESAEITVDRQKLERFLVKILRDDLPSVPEDLVKILYVNE